MRRDAVCFSISVCLSSCLSVVFKILFSNSLVFLHAYSNSSQLLSCCLLYAIAPDRYFLLATRNAIRQVTINETGSKLKDVMEPIWLTDDTIAVAIDYNPKSQMIYYSDVSGGKIVEISINNSQKLVADGLGVVDGLAVDWASDLLYYTDTSHDIIGVVHTSGAPRKAIIESGLDQPRDIALDPANASVSCCLVALRTVC